ncbi:MAG TPA: 4Fe-4S binding protein [Firmicutes bacterium]|nr:4Fe-4S binding protein [Bacillota bacterium]
MSHLAAKSAYRSLEERINRLPQGAPPSKTLYKILSLLFTEQEAALVAQLPIRPFTAKTASKLWGLPLAQTEAILQRLAKRAILLDVEQKGVQTYTLPPPMAGFFEFSLMRTRHDIDQKLLAELYYQYLNVEEDFIKELFLGSETRLGRVFVQEPVLSNEQAIHVLDYERASHFIQTTPQLAVSMCYCRHKMEHLGRACDAPQDICLTFGNTALSLAKHGYARLIDAQEGMELLHRAYERDLVQCGENVRKNVSFICNCCSCCCEGLTAVRKFGALQPIHTTNYLASVTDGCAGCGRCADKCPALAIELSPVVPGEYRQRAEVKTDICLGCGICVRHCPHNSIVLERREQRVITPANSVHRLVLMAIEKGKLQDLLVNNQALASHRAMAAVLSAILKLPPIKRAMASKQLRSVYLDRLLERLS